MIHFTQHWQSPAKPHVVSEGLIKQTAALTPPASDVINIILELAANIRGLLWDGLGMCC